LSAVVPRTTVFKTVRPGPKYSIPEERASSMTDAEIVKSPPGAPFFASMPARTPCPESPFAATRVSRMSVASILALASETETPN
jgi:hypothetical protein